MPKPLRLMCFFLLLRKMSDLARQRHLLVDEREPQKRPPQSHRCRVGREMDNVNSCFKCSKLIIVYNDLPNLRQFGVIFQRPRNQIIFHQHNPY